MQIWLVNHYAVPETESGGTRHVALAKELARQHHHVTIFASAFRHVIGSASPAGSSRAGTDGALVSETKDGVTFVQIPTPPYRGNGWGRIRNMLTFASRFSTEGRSGRFARPDVVVGSSPHPFAALAARRIARRFGVPFVLEVRDLWPDSLVKVGGASRRHPLVLILSLVERSLYRSARAVVSLLPNAADHIVERGGRRDRVVWLPNGVDFDLAGPLTSADRADLRPFTVMYAGSMGKANALDSILDAAALLAGRERRIEFRLLGEGPERKRLEERAASEGLEHVHFEAPVPKQRVFDVLREADVLIATTRNIDLYEHGLSLNKLFDYLAVGRPVVFGASCPSNPVLEANAGVVVPPEDAGAMAKAISALADLTPDERAVLGARGRAYAESHHDMRRLGRKLEQVLVQSTLST